MARTPSMMIEDAESLLGQRGSVNIDSTNRAIAKKWLVAHGFPSLFVGGLSLKEMNNAYNQTNGAGLEAIRRKLSIANRDAGADADANRESDEEIEAQVGAEETPDNGPSDPVESDERFKEERRREVKAEIDRELAKYRKEKAEADAKNREEFQKNRMAEEKAKADEAKADAPEKSDAEKALEVLERALKSKLDEDRVREIAREEDAKIVFPSVNHVMRDAREIVLGKSDGYHHPMFQSLVRAAKAKDTYGFHQNVFISGEASSGKTFATRQLAKLFGREYHFNGAISQPHEMLGFIDAGGTYHDTPFRRAYEHGGIYVFDEVDRSDPNAVLAVNPHLAGDVAEFPDRQIAKHPDTIIIATGNTWGAGADANYSGANKLDAAFLSRFPIRVGWNIDKAFEKRIVGNDEWVARVQKARAKAQAAGIKVMIDTRIAIAGAALIADGATLDEAAAMTYLANLKPEQRKMVEAV